MTQSLTCQDLLKTLPDYMEGELDETLCADLRRHMDECEHCRIVVDTVNKTIYLYHHAEDEEKPVAEDVRGRLFDALHLDDYRATKNLAK
jgi:predicted anti-sigma-YlaC factor YlaD